MSVSITPNPNVQGPQGLTGTQGATGAQGTTGAQGLQGIQGFSGTAYSATFNAKTTAYTLLASDANVWVTMNAATSQAITVPANVFTSGQLIYVQRIGAGAVPITASGVTITSNGATSSAPNLRAQYSSATILCTGSNTFTVVGDIS